MALTKSTRAHGRDLHTRRTLIWINALVTPVGRDATMGNGEAASLAPTVAALCGIGDPFLALGVAGALFGAGLFGGFSHCAAMCSPFVIMQIADAEGETLSLHRLSSGALPGYHLGRMTTYAALGGAFGGAGGSVVQFTQFRWLLAILLAAAALCFLLQAIKRIAPLPPAGFFRGASDWWGKRVGRLATPLLRQPRDPRVRGYGLGIVLGFLPCGFLYAALIAAGASGSAAAGALAMAAFALGTVPGLVAVGLFGSAAFGRWRPLASAIAAPIFLLNAATLTALAARMIA